MMNETEVERRLRAGLDATSVDAIVTNQHVDTLVKELVPYLTDNSAQPAPVAVPEGVARALRIEEDRLTKIIESGGPFSDQWHVQRIHYAEHDRQAIRDHLAALSRPEPVVASKIQPIVGHAWPCPLFYTGNWHAAPDGGVPVPRAECVGRPGCPPVAEPEDEPVVARDPQCECEMGWQCTFCREFSRGYNGNAPEPVVAPLPSEAVEAAIERAIYNGAEAVDPDEHAEIMRAVMDVVTPHLRLVPEDDEDTVRVPREAVERLRRSFERDDYSRLDAVPEQALASIAVLRSVYGDPA